MNLLVLHEDTDLLAINKPAGLVCHGGRDGDHSSLIGRVRMYLGHAEGRLVNRLDRETSGVVLIAKDAGAASELGKLFGANVISKRYWAIVHGHLAMPQVTIDAPLGRDESSAVAIKDCVRDDGARATTVVTSLKAFRRDDHPYSWVEAVPRSGRKHQIRIHLAHIGHPIVGDKIYGGDEQRYLRFVTKTMTSEDWHALKATHHALHARELAFTWRQRDWRFEADPEPDFQAWLD